MKPVILIDYNLKSFGSHNGTTAVLLLKSNTLAEVWANVVFELDDPRIRHVFKYSGANRRCAFPSSAGNKLLFALRISWRMLVSNFHYARALFAAHRAESAETIWLARDGDPKMFYALLVAALRLRKNGIIAYFHNQPNRFLMKPAAWLIRLLRVRNLHIAAEDPSLCQKFESILGLPCHYLFNPVPFSPPAAVRQKSVLRGVMLGGARKEKGFDVMIRALEPLRPVLESGALELCLQCPDPVEDEFASLLASVDLPPNVTIWRQTFSPNEYEQVLQDADFSILPYRKSAYELRNSGIVIESIAAGLPMVVTEGTLFATTASEHGVAVSFADGAVSELAEAIQALIKRFPAAAESAREKSMDWQSSHSVEAFFSQLNVIADPKG